MSRLHANATRSAENFWTDFGFCTLFTVGLTLTTFYAYKAFKLNPQMVSLPNILVMLLIQLTLLSKSTYY